MPPIDGKFKNSWSRLKRATDHLRAFEAEWNRLMANKPSTTVSRYDDGSGWYTASFTPDEVQLEALNGTPLPLILGEYVYQLRSALDGLIWDAVTFSAGAEPTTNAASLYFPIYTGKRKRDFQRDGFVGFKFPKKLEDWLKSIQPDPTEKPAGHPDRGLPNALEIIHDLARFDRHRRLRIIASSPTELFANIVFDPPEGFTAVAHEGLLCDLFSGKYDLFRFKVKSTSGALPNKIRIETGVLFEVLFEDIPRFQGMRSGETLSMLLNAVIYITTRFEEEFA